MKMDCILGGKPNGDLIGGHLIMDKYVNLWIFENLERNRWMMMKSVIPEIFMAYDSLRNEENLSLNHDWNRITVWV